jgi:hypothetical protein
VGVKPCVVVATLSRRLWRCRGDFGAAEATLLQRRCRSDVGAVTASLALLGQRFGVGVGAVGANAVAANAAAALRQAK